MRGASRHDPSGKAGTRLLCELPDRKGALLTSDTPVVVTCLTGTLWVAGEQSTQDLILEAGDTCGFDKPVHEILLSSVFSVRTVEFEISAAPCRVMIKRPYWLSRRSDELVMANI
jgi:hypothetical protein